MPLAFDESTHTYTFDGVRLPSVTQVIDAILPPNFPGAGEWHMQRGTATHLACELLDQGRLDWCSVDPEIEPRVLAWQSFRVAFPRQVIGNECKLAHPVYCYAGKIDRVLDGDDGPIIADLKNSFSPQAYLQLAGYSLLWQANRKEKVRQAVAVELLDAGTYRCHWVNERELRRYEQQFLSLLNVYRFAKENGLLKKER